MPKTVIILNKCTISLLTISLGKVRKGESAKATYTPLCVLPPSNYSPFANDPPDSRNPLVWKLVPRSRLITISRAT